MNSININAFPERSRSLNIWYATAEIIVGLITCLGNSLVIFVYIKNRSVRRRYCNYYIMSLAIADLLVGLIGTTFALILSVGYPENLIGCLFTICTLFGLCYVSIVCLVGVSFDRFFAITKPFLYYSTMTSNKAIGIICICWTIGMLLGFIPIMGWYNPSGWTETGTCYLTNIVNSDYLAFICFSAIIVPSFILSFIYGYIYCVVKAKLNEIPITTGEIFNQETIQNIPGVSPLAFHNQSQNQRTISSDTSTNPKHILCLMKQDEMKTAMKLGILVVAFVICWLPLYTINTVQAFCPDYYVSVQLLDFTIVLTHANSALNPFLYAYHLKEFRVTMGKALINLFNGLVQFFCCLRRQYDETLQRTANT